MKGKLPEKILNRKKMAFFFPIKNWLKNELKNFAKDNFFKNYKIFKIKEIEKLWKKFEEDKIHWSRIWAIIILNSYLENKKL
jgi:asparagine synthetase B (glutamine-hydrolysing)